MLVQITLHEPMADSPAPLQAINHVFILRIPLLSTFAIPSVKNQNETRLFSR